MPSVTCQHCGSDQLRRARVHSLHRKVYRRLTGLTRFECTSCKTRGWTGGALPTLAVVSVPRPAGAGRPAEKRDVVAARQATFRILVSISVSVALGVLLALFLLRHGE